MSVIQASDGDFRAEFNPAREGQSLFASQRHRDAVGKYNDFSQLDVYWRPPSWEKPGDPEVRCHVGLYEKHGIRLGAKLAAEEVDFVINRFWELTR